MVTARRAIDSLPFALALLALALLVVVHSAPGQAIDLEPPGEREFILDHADLLDETTEQHIRATCDALLTDEAVPIVVVTIRRMNDYTSYPVRNIETFATILFDQWGIGHESLGGQPWNKGILLLVSTGDRKARIELGAGWGNEKDGESQRIMDGQIVARFKRGDFPGGIVAGVQSLDAMVRGEALPRGPVNWWRILGWAVAIGLGIFTIVSFMRRGTNGWAWVFWGVVFTVISTVLVSLASNSRGGRGGGGFSGGSFGGGFSGGGGATGSW